MAKAIIVLQNNPLQPCGSLLKSAARKRGVRLNLVKLWQEPIPTLTPFDALIVIGGSSDLKADEGHPFLRLEKEVIKRSISDDRPYLGFCLGHQLLADTLGAQIGPNSRPSLGFVRGYLTHDGREHPLFRGIPRSLPLFKCHNQAVLPPLPKGLLTLATSNDCQVEALSVAGRPHLVSLQADNHAASPEEIRRILITDRQRLTTDTEAPADSETLLIVARAYRRAIRQDFERLFNNFLTFT
ncbi:MAG: type 1 glutamine amidotransferase [Proteobacteria bacterium]|nr:type 1 glutamine amidotransferase [Pseudomonadota bacterium]